jgi:DNA polymerase (family 10)
MPAPTPNHDPSRITPILSNSEIADHLANLAQLLSASPENHYRVRAYQRAAKNIRNLSESLDELVREGADLTRFTGIGAAIAGKISEIVLAGKLGTLEKLRSQASPEIGSLGAYPRLDPKTILRIYKKLGISSIDELKSKLDEGEIQTVMGARAEHHVRQGLTESHAMLLYRADDLHLAVEEYLLGRCRVKRAEAAGDFRRRVEVIEDLDFIIEADNLAPVIAQLQRYGGHAPLLSSGADRAEFALPAGMRLRVQLATARDWGLALITGTGSAAHLKRLTKITGSLKALRGHEFPTETSLYAKFGLSYIEPELREGRDEVARAAEGRLPVLVAQPDIQGELHAHSTSSDGADSIEAMALAARAHGYQYIGITDHSQSLKIAHGLPVEALWRQIRAIDVLNGRLDRIRVLKSAEVDILADGSLDYPDELLRELDYTVCSIHSRFGLNRAQQTERILRAMDNRYFHILGHATGRLLLKRPGYEIDIERVIAHASRNGCFFEINSSPDRLDLSAENARRAAEAGVAVAISTDAHSTREFDLVRYGIDQARRAGLEKSAVLNCRSWEKLAPLLRR